MRDLPSRLQLALAYAVSGGCALVYQVVWYHAFVDDLGASGTTFLVVLCAFIGGLGVGAISSAHFYRALTRRFGGHGLKNYGRTEILVTFTALGLFGLVHLPLSIVVGHFPYRVVSDGGLRLFVPALSYEVLRVLLAVAAVGVPCFFMGLTFPYLCSLFPEDGRLPSWLYAANTLGASVAVLVTEFIGVRTIGYLGCLALAAAGTLGLGLFFVRFPATPLPDDAPAPAPAGASEPRVSAYPGVLSGFLCGGWQTLCYTFVKLLLGTTRGAFALLAFFSIIGIWGAATVVHRRAPGSWVLAAASWTGVAWCGVLWWIEPNVTERLMLLGVRVAGVVPVGWAAFLASFLAVGLLIFVPYALWSLLLPDLCDRVQSRGGNLSVVYGLNTLSFLAGVLAFGWALPYVNVFFAARCFGLAAVVGVALLSVPPRWRFAAVAPLAAGCFLLPRGLEMRLVGGLDPEARQVIDYRSTPQHLFWVRRVARENSLFLMFDRHAMSGDNLKAQVYMRTMAHLPLFLHPAPERALLICFGIGVTADAIRSHETISAVDVVDLNRSVYLLNHYFAKGAASVLGDPRFRFFVDDGRQFVKLVDDRYDFVTMEPPPPLQPGIARLYSAEHYAALKQRLRPGGIVSQWLPEYELDQEAVDLIVTTFVQAFPHTLLFVGFNRDLILAGSDSPFDFAGFTARVTQSPAAWADLMRFGFTQPSLLLGTLMRTESTLRELWKDGPVIRDGIVSLDGIDTTPVQYLVPDNRFLAPKRNLRFDPADVMAALGRAGVPGAAAIERVLTTPPGGRVLGIASTLYTRPLDATPPGR